MEPKPGRNHCPVQLYRKYYDAAFNSPPMVVDMITSKEEEIKKRVDLIKKLNNKLNKIIKFPPSNRVNIVMKRAVKIISLVIEIKILYSEIFTIQSQPSRSFWENKFKTRPTWSCQVEPMTIQKAMSVGVVLNEANNN
jgi:hypothetical protein